MVSNAVILQKRNIQLLVIVGLVVAIVWRIETASTERLTARYVAPADSLSIAPVASAANEGNKLAHVDGCFSCHGDRLTGHVVFAGWLGTRLVAPNLTRLAHQETDTQLANAIRYGIKHNGTSVIGMPSHELIKSSDSDIAAIIAYLHTLPQRPDTAGKTLWRFGGRTMLAIGMLPSEAERIDESARGPLKTPTAPLALGHYITQAHCSVCHGADLSGKTLEGSPSLPFSIQHYTPAAFRRFFRTGNGQIGHGTKTMTRMIRSRFKYLTPADVQAIYVYLKSDYHLRTLTKNGVMRTDGD